MANANGNVSKEEVNTNKREETFKKFDHFQPEYVVVSESADAEPLELPTNIEDNTLGLTTLTHAFPGATGLKYKNPATGATRALL